MSVSRLPLQPAKRGPTEFHKLCFTCALEVCCLVLLLIIGPPYHTYVYTQVAMVYIGLFDWFSTLLISPTDVKNLTNQTRFSKQLFTGFAFTNMDSDDVTWGCLSTVIVSAIVGFRNLSNITMKPTFFIQPFNSVFANKYYVILINFIATPVQVMASSFVPITADLIGWLWWLRKWQICGEQDDMETLPVLLTVCEVNHQSLPDSTVEGWICLTNHKWPGPNSI